MLILKFYEINIYQYQKFKKKFLNGTINLKNKIEKTTRKMLHCCREILSNDFYFFPDNLLFLQFLKFL